MSTAKKKKKEKNSSDLMGQESGFPSPHKMYPIGWQKDPQKAIRADLVQSLRYVPLFSTQWTAGFPVLHCLLEFAQIHLH